MVEDYEIHDSIRIQKVLIDHRKRGLSIMECRDVWSAISLDMDAGWLILPSSDEDLLRYLDEYFYDKEKRGERRDTHG